ncbi:phenylacetate--CoA ligase family protein [Polaribacter butkevichii]|uniref:AMP-binding protein n=1 Tax=Polaribacter butkevichii TaxID=218490 RepID=A0A2P6CEH4_9FLAO|nr:AMP-binding protein [Polaribacter butkevichii]PQJ73303.1 hypothetical protein BTO14_08530 [Polaribacter butkevichii]
MIYNKLIENIFLPIGDFINKSSYLKQLKYWRKLDTFTEIELENLQKKNLKNILEHTVNTVSKYSSIQLEGKDPYGWLNSFPILTKDDIRGNSDSLLSNKVNKANLISYSSSGSSGIQSTVFMDKKEQSIIRAILSHWWEWSGYRIGSSVVQTGMSPNRGLLKSIKDGLFKTKYITAFSLTDTQLENLFKELHNTKNYYLAGYASSLNIIAEYALAHNYKVHFKAAISFGDKMFNHYKKNIENAFKTKVYDTYGCNEGFLIAAQKDLEYKYIMSPHVYLEILDDNNKPLPDGELGHVVVTRLDGYSMPLIRYKIGDLAMKLPKEKYPKNREFNYPLLEKIIGRDTDVVLLSDNKKLTVHSFTGIFEYVTEIKQFKVIQEKQGEILIEYIKDKGFNKDVLLRVTKELQKYILDNEFKIFYKEVDFIAAAKSGKPQIVESKLLKK